MIFSSCEHKINTRDGFGVTNAGFVVVDVFLVVDAFGRLGWVARTKIKLFIAANFAIITCVGMCFKTGFFSRTVVFAPTLQGRKGSGDQGGGGGGGEQRTGLAENLYVLLMCYFVNGLSEDLRTTYPFNSMFEMNVYECAKDVGEGGTLNSGETH